MGGKNYTYDEIIDEIEKSKINLELLFLSGLYKFQDNKNIYSIKGDLIPLIDKYGKAIVFNTIKNRLNLSDDYKISCECFNIFNYVSFQIDRPKKLNLSDAFMQGILKNEKLEDML